MVSVLGSEIFWWPQRVERRGATRPPISTSRDNHGDVHFLRGGQQRMARRRHVILGLLEHQRWDTQYSNGDGSQDWHHTCNVIQVSMGANNAFQPADVLVAKRRKDAAARDMELP